MKLPRYDVDNWLAKKERHHLTVIRRRITYLDERIARATEVDRDLTYDKQEAAALRWAIKMIEIAGGKPVGD